MTSPLEKFAPLRNRRYALAIAEKIRKLYDQLKRRGIDEISIMHVCGTHEHTIVQFGIRSLLPRGIRLIAGPGCPVCIVPAKEIDEAVELALSGVRVYTYGDMYRVPGTRMSLAQAHSEGGDVRVVYSFSDAVRLAMKDTRESVFFAVGFETTAPTSAVYVVRRKIPRNLKLLVSYRLVVPAVRYVLSHEHELSGIIAPGHVSTIVGAGAWRFVAEEFRLPVVVAGFEAIDVLLAVMEILRQLRDGEAKVHNEYSRVVRWEGNTVAQRYTWQAYEAVDAAWRGIGVIEKSGLALRSEFREYDAREHYEINVGESVDVRPGCKCPEIILGRAVPTDCPYFMKACRPDRPLGPCMVSSEGTCAIWAKYGGWVELQEE